MEDGDDVPGAAGGDAGVLVGGGFVGDGEMAAVDGVDALHDGAEYGAVGRGVGQSVVVDEVVNHLVDEGVVYRGLCEVEACADAQLEVGVPSQSVAVGDYARHALPEVCARLSEPHRYARQPSAKHEAVVMVKLSGYVVNCRAHM